MTVEEGRVHYEREILQRGGWTGIFERGTGTVSDAGELVVTGSATDSDYTFEAEYRGRITGDRVYLEGTQRWRRRGEVRAPPCRIDLAR